MKISITKFIYKCGEDYLDTTDVEIREDEYNSNIILIGDEAYSLSELKKAIRIIEDI